MQVHPQLLTQKNSLVDLPQECLPDGVTVAAVTVRSEKATCQIPSENVVISLRYLSLTKLDTFSAPWRSAIQYQLFHNCMDVLLNPLIEAVDDWRPLP